MTKIKNQVCSHLNSDCDLIHNNNIKKGFWNDTKEVGTILMLCVSELSEALDADRIDNFASISNFNDEFQDNNQFEYAFRTHIKDTFEDEIADTFIRLMDLCGAYDIDIEWHINKKLEYNKLRKKMHGKNY